MREPYVPLFCSIVDSTLWSADSNSCKVWITLLAMADPEGYVAPAIDGIAARARLPVDVVRPILDWLQRPDPDSRSDEHEGRRLMRVPRGWRVLNLKAFRELARHEAEKARKRKWARENNSGRPMGASNSARRTETETETDRILPDPTETETETESQIEEGIPKGNPEPRKKRARKPRAQKPLCTVPLDFAPNAGHVALAAEQGVSIDEELPKFLDHHTGKGTLWRDWAAAFRLWLRNSKTFSARSGGGNRPSQGRSRNSDALDYAENVFELR